MIKEDDRSVPAQPKTWEREKLRIMELEAELKAANRRVADLEESATILKKATAIFATQHRK